MAAPQDDGLFGVRIRWHERMAICYCEGVGLLGCVGWVGGVGVDGVLPNPLPNPGGWLLLVGDNCCDAPMLVPVSPAVPP